MAKPPGRCIFCRGFGLSKEHLFSDWLREIFPRSDQDTHSVGEADSAPWRVTPQQGHSGSKKFRIVCKTCNNGWMNHVDDNAKSAAAPLIRGEKKSVTPEMQHVLALWFAKIATVGDGRKPKRSVIPQVQRNHIMERKRPPDEWEIWVASYGGTDYRDLALLQRNGVLDFTPVLGPGESFKGFAETTFLGMGKLTALVIADDLPFMDFNVGTYANVARRIWPVGETFNWPLPHSLNDAEATSAAHILEAMRSNFRDPD